MFDKLLDCSERNPVLKPMVECVQENPRIVKLFVSGMASYSSCLTEAAGANCVAFPGMIFSNESAKAPQSAQSDGSCGMKAIQNFVVECFHGCNPASDPDVYKHPLITCYKEAEIFKNAMALYGECATAKIKELKSDVVRKAFQD